MGIKVFTDCTTSDIERLRPEINRLALAFQAMQQEVTKDMEIRDSMIVTVASLDMCQVSIERGVKKQTTPRFARSIRKAMLIARKFGVGRVATQAPPSN